MSDKEDKVEKEEERNSYGIAKTEHSSNDQDFGRMSFNCQSNSSWVATPMKKSVLSTSTLC